MNYDVWLWLLEVADAQSFLAVVSDDPVAGSGWVNNEVLEQSEKDGAIVASLARYVSEAASQMLPFQASLSLPALA